MRTVEDAFAAESRATGKLGETKTGSGFKNSDGDGDGSHKTCTHPGLMRYKKKKKKKSYRGDIPELTKTTGKRMHRVDLDRIFLS